jgi:hypothetical protein
MVMLGPPNQGSELATHLAGSRLAKFLGGGALHEIAKNWLDLEQRLATPRFEFGIIAGGTGRNKRRNPLLNGDNDFVVTVASTRLAGAKDFLVLPVWHTTMMDDPKVQECSERFLTHGYFLSAEQCHPLGAG